MGVSPEHRHMPSTQLQPRENKFREQAVGEYRKIEKKCTTCEQQYTTNVPENWFTENGTLNKQVLAQFEISPETAQSIIDSTVCGACDPVNQEKIKQAVAVMKSKN